VEGEPPLVATLLPLFFLVSGIRCRHKNLWFFIDEVNVSASGFQDKKEDHINVY
jgi:hypothetical protein